MAGNQLPEYKQALQLQEQGNFEEAEASFRKALLIAPGDVPVLFRLACLLTNELERHEEARQLFEQAIQTDADHLNSHFCLADLLACHLGRCEEAEYHYREALRINPRNLNTHFNLGALLTAELGRHKEAEGHYRAALCIDPEDADTHFNLAELLKDHLGRPTEAEKHYREALRIDPNDKQVHCNLARLLTDHLNRHAEAEEHFRQALNLDWEYAEAHVNFGLLLTEMLARHEDAQKHFEEALRLTPDDLDTHFNLAELLTDHLSKHTEAEEHYRTALKLHADDFDTHFNLAHLLSTHLERHEEAETHLREAMRIEPEDRRVQRTLATLLSVHLGKEEEAKEMLAKIKEAEPAEGAMSMVPQAAHQNLLAEVDKLKVELRMVQEEAQNANNRKTELASQLKAVNREMAEMMHANFGLKDKLAQMEATMASSSSSVREKKLAQQLQQGMLELSEAQRGQLKAEQELETLRQMQASDGPTSNDGEVAVLQERLQHFSKELQTAQMDILKWKNDTRAALQAKDKAEAELETAEGKLSEVQAEMDLLLEGAGQVSEEETAKIKNLREELASMSDAKAAAESEIDVFRKRITELEEHAATQNELMDELIAGQANVASVEGEVFTAKARASELEDQLEACIAELNAYKEAEAAAAAVREKAAEELAVEAGVDMDARDDTVEDVKQTTAKPSSLRQPGVAARDTGAKPRRRADSTTGKVEARSGGRSATPSRRTGQRPAQSPEAKKLPSYMQPKGSTTRSARNTATGSATAKGGAPPKPGAAAVKNAKEMQGLEKQLKQLQNIRVKLEGELAEKDDEIALLKARDHGSGGGETAAPAELDAAKAQVKQAREEATMARQDAQKNDEARIAAVKREEEAKARLAELDEQLSQATKAGQGASKAVTALAKTKVAVSGFAKGFKDDLKAARSDLEVGKMSMQGMFANLTNVIGRSITIASTNAQASAGKETDEMREKYRIECMKRKKLYNQLQELRGNLRVYCRMRPPTEVEAAEGIGATVFDQELGMVRIKDERNGKAVGKREFEFDRVYDQCSQETVFEDVDPLITSILDGYNVCIFAYGQTGSGKTFTMDGPVENPGVSRRAVHAIFREIQGRLAEEDAILELSMLEVYLDDILDLLTKDRSKKLSIMNDKGGDGIIINNLTVKQISSAEEVLETLAFGMTNRSVGKTDMNAHSSRSHLVLKLNVRMTNKTSGATSIGKLSLVDLAGSERVGKSGAEGDRLKEAQAINKSLSALGSVVRTLANGGAHIPYRDSKLTHVLADSIGGDSKTLMFCNVSPRDRDLQETMCSLNFAVQAKEVTSGPAKKHSDNVSSPRPGALKHSPKGTGPGSPMTPGSQERRKARSSPVPRERG